MTNEPNEREVKTRISKEPANKRNSEQKMIMKIENRGVVFKKIGEKRERYCESPFIGS